MSPPSPPPNMTPLHDFDLSDRQWGVRRNRVEAILQHSRLLAGHPFSPSFVQDHATVQIIKSNVMGLLQRRGDLRTPTETPPTKVGSNNYHGAVDAELSMSLSKILLSPPSIGLSCASTCRCLLSPPSIGMQPIHNFDLSDRRWGCQRNRVEAVLLPRLAPMHRLSSPLLIKDHETALQTIKTRVMEHLGSLAEKGDDCETGFLDLSSMHRVSTESPPKRIRFVDHNKEEEVVDTKMSMSLSKTQIEGDLMAMRGSKLVRPEVRILRGEAKPSPHCKKAEVSNKKFSLCLTRKEIEDDFMAIRGSKPPCWPEKKRSRKIQKKLDEVFPGLWLWK